MAENVNPSASKRKRTNNPDAARKKSVGSSRRSATPFVPYEPPTNVFTPPREVFLTPMTNTMSKSSKRKTVASTSVFKSAKAKAKRKGPTFVLAVKQELPDIDLTLPMPPPSPSDDPLLLSGPFEIDDDDDAVFTSKFEEEAVVTSKFEEEAVVTPKFEEEEEAVEAVMGISDVDQISDDSDELSPGIVKITSADPRSAARAAALLTQHDYDCYTNIEIKQRYQEAKRRRQSEIMDSPKESRRRDLFEVYGGDIGKREWTKEDWKHLDVGLSPPEESRMSDVFEVYGGDNGEQEWIKEDRKHLDADQSPPNESGMCDVFEVYGDDNDKREWTKEDWKHLDACFTDQRLEVGSRLAGVEQNMLAPVDMVSIDDVVDKFVISKGGFETITRFGELWSRENLLERTRALQKKQRSGNIARPTTPYTPPFNGNRNVLRWRDSGSPCLQIPDFTPLARHAALPRKSKEPIIIPPTLLAPRYSHLFEEAIAISQEGSVLSPEKETSPKSEINDTFSDISSTIAISQDESTLSPEQETFSKSEVKDASHSSDVPIGKRVKGLLFSYLPTLPKLSSSSTTASKASVQHRLPLPPVEILSKPRGPITTPARAPILKPKHPKELVVLHPAPQPQTVSHIPRLKKPQRLVELHPPAPLPMIVDQPIIPRPRRSSGSSVKDLVRGFEEIQAVSRDKWKFSFGRKTGDQKKPQWKP